MTHVNKIRITMAISRIRKILPNVPSARLAVDFGLVSQPVADGETSDPCTAAVVSKAIFIPPIRLSIGGLL
jgi:hypothetical protein